MFKNFERNLKSLRECFQKAKGNAKQDAKFIVQDHNKHFIIDKPGFAYPRWDQSAASILLKNDVDQSKNIRKSPKQL